MFICSQFALCVVLDLIKLCKYCDFHSEVYFNNKFKTVISFFCYLFRNSIQKNLGGLISTRNSIQSSLYLLTCLSVCSCQVWISPCLRDLLPNSERDQKLRRWRKRRWNVSSWIYMRDRRKRITRVRYTDSSSNSSTVENCFFTSEWKAIFLLWILSPATCFLVYVQLLRVVVVGGRSGFQPLMGISPTANWIRWCMQVYAWWFLMWTCLVWAKRSTPDNFWVPSHWFCNSWDFGQWPSFMPKYGNFENRPVSQKPLPVERK